jgi:hypothetical protein
MSLALIWRLGFGAALFGVFVAGGCLNPFAPALDDGGLSSQLITDQSTPEEALVNFKYAYIFKDSLLYADLLDSSFVFQYFDPDQGASGIFVSWTREVDLQTTGRLFRAFDVIGLEWLNTISSCRDDNSCRNENEETLTKSFQLELASREFHFSVSGLAAFTFRRSPTDKKWRIQLWLDKSDL